MIETLGGCKEKLVLCGKM